MSQSIQTIKVISGGQTGADQAGLFAARDCGFETGGFAPSGYRTLAGYEVKLLKSFGLKEHYQFGYAFRTAENVKISDATIRLAFNFKSNGEKCTYNAIKRYDKPHFDIPLDYIPNPYIIARWIINNNIKVLNIAGNGDGKKNDKVFNVVYHYLVSVFKEIRKEQNG